MKKLLSTIILLTATSAYAGECSCGSKCTCEKCNCTEKQCNCKDCDCDCGCKKE